jgi:hypothetical protein
MFHKLPDRRRRRKPPSRGSVSHYDSPPKPSASDGIDRGEHPHHRLARSVFLYLDDELRRRWWRETDWGDRPEKASPRLIAELEEYADE